MGMFDGIKNIIKEKRESMADERQLKKEALTEAREELKQVYKEQIIKAETEKIQKKASSGGFFANLGKGMAKEFEQAGNTIGKKDMSGLMMGPRVDSSKLIGPNVSQDKISKRLPGRKTVIEEDHNEQPKPKSKWM